MLEVNYSRGISQKTGKKQGPPNPALSRVNLGTAVKLHCRHLLFGY